MHLWVIIGPGHVSGKDGYSASLGYPIEHVVADLLGSPIDVRMIVDPVSDFDDSNCEKSRDCDDKQDSLTGRDGLWIESLDQRHGRNESAKRGNDSHDHVHRTSPTEAD